MIEQNNEFLMKNHQSHPRVLNHSLKLMEPLFRRKRTINDIGMEEINKNEEERILLRITHHTT